MYATQTDEEIAFRVQKGDHEAFGQLMERYEQKMIRYARKFLLHGEEGRDLVQEVFIKAYENMRSFDVKKKFSPWIYRIAHNEFINAIKKRGREKLVFLDLDVVFPHLASSLRTDANIHDEDTKKLVEQSMEKIEPKYREPLVLYYLEDMDYKKISEILRIPVSTVGVRLSRGKALLKKAVLETDTSYGKR